MALGNTLFYSVSEEENILVANHFNVPTKLVRTVSTSEPEALTLKRRGVGRIREG